MPANFSNLSPLPRMARGRRFFAVFGKSQLLGDRSSRSEAVTVAVGFSPRSDAPRSVVAERRLKKRRDFGSLQASLRDAPPLFPGCGLKPTATVTWSVHGLRTNEEFHSSEDSEEPARKGTESHRRRKSRGAWRRLGSADVSHVNRPNRGLEGRRI